MMTFRRFINLFPKKFILLKLYNFLLFKLSVSFRQKTISYLPVTMDIEPTTGCNFRCTMCQVSSPNFEAKNMDLETFKLIIQQNKQLIKIKLQGMGEPLVNKNLFLMVDYAKEFGIATEIITNGSMLTDGNIKKLILSKLSKITISIDGASKEVFEKIRVKSNFDTVIKNANQFKELIKKKYLRPEFSAWCTLQNDNFFEAEEIIKLCKKVGFDDLTFQLHLTGWGKEEWNKINNSKQVDISEKENIDKLKNLIEIHKSNKFKIKIFEENILNFNKKCSWPWNSSYVSAQGAIVPCCIVADPKVINYGNIKEKSFKEIWNSNEYQNLRQNIKENKLNEFCKNCYQEYK